MYLIYKSECIWPFQALYLFLKKHLSYCYLPHGYPSSTAQADSWWGWRWRLCEGHRFQKLDSILLQPRVEWKKEGTKPATRVDRSICLLYSLSASGLDWAESRSVSLRQSGAENEAVSPGHRARDSVSQSERKSIERQFCTHDSTCMHAWVDEIGAILVWCTVRTMRTGGNR